MDKITHRPLQGTCGFSMMQLLVVMGIIGIVTAISVPSLAHYIQRSTLRSVQSDVAALSLFIEHEHRDKQRYPTLALTTTAAVQAKFAQWRPTSGYFTYSIISASSKYTVIATATLGPLAGCAVSITDTGVQALTNCEDYSENGGWL